MPALRLDDLALYRPDPWTFVDRLFPDVPWLVNHGPVTVAASGTNIGTLFAFVLVCAGVLVLRVLEPARPRPFMVPMAWIVAPLGAAACVFVMLGLPGEAWTRFGGWLVLGLVVYAAYGRRHSSLR